MKCTYCNADLRQIGMSFSRHGNILHYECDCPTTLWVKAPGKKLVRIKTTIQEDATDPTNYNISRDLEEFE